MKIIISKSAAGFILGLVCCWNAAAQDIMAAGGVTRAKYESTTAGSAPYSPAAENYARMTDNNINSKYLLFNWATSAAPSGGVWILFKCNTPKLARKYTITSANDDITRDPKDWQLLGSNDSTTWTLLDTRTNQSFPNRLQTNHYVFANTTAYKFYQLNVTANNGHTTPNNGIFQCAEWRLWEPLPPVNAPTVFKGGALSGSSVYIEWKDNSNDETGFAIERSIDNVNFVQVGTVNTPTTTFIDNSAALNTQYFYRVRAINEFGGSGYSYFSATTLNYSGLLEDITNNGGVVSGSIVNTNVNENVTKVIDNIITTKYLVNTSSWTPYWIMYKSTSPYPEIITRYTITSANDAASRDPRNWTFQGSNDSTNWDVLDTRTGVTFPARFSTQTFFLPNATPGYKYYKLMVTANNGSTGISGQIGEWEIWGVPKNAPQIPGNVAASSISPTEIQVNWSDLANNESGYEISQSPDSVNFAVVTTTAANATSYNHTGLSISTKYYYRIRAIGSQGNSMYSKIVSATTNVDPNLPLPPSNLTATAQGQSEMILAWSDNSGNETGFEVARSVNGTSYSLVTTLNADATGYTDTGLSLGTLYYYKVRAINTFGNSAYSGVAKDTTSGTNTPPTLGAIADQTSCNTTDTHTVLLTGITTGGEPGQVVTFSVTHTKASIFDMFSISEVVNGQAELKYKLVPGVVGTDTIRVTAKDNGGKLNGGADTSPTRTFVITATQLQITITPDIEGTLIPRGATVNLTASGADNYEWSTGPGIIEGQTSNVLVVKPTQNYIYKVKATTVTGCTKDAEISIKIDGNFKAEPINILTPNNDGKNDVWLIWNINAFPNNVVKVFDTEGRLVYSKKNYNNEWDGTFNGSPLQGVYYYNIELGSGIPAVRGSLTIIRE